MISAVPFFAERRFFVRQSKTLFTFLFLYTRICTRERVSLKILKEIINFRQIITFLQRILRKRGLYCVRSLKGTEQKPNTPISLFRGTPPYNYKNAYPNKYAFLLSKTALNSYLPRCFFAVFYFFKRINPFHYPL